MGLSDDQTLELKERHKSRVLLAFGLEQLSEFLKGEMQKGTGLWKITRSVVGT